MITISVSDTGKDIPVIIISILEKSRRGLELGAFEYFVKPVEKQELLCRLESCSLHEMSLRRSENGSRKDA